MTMFCSLPYIRRAIVASGSGPGLPSSNNDGAAFFGMIPLMTCDLGRIKLNAVYFPKFAQYNEVDAFGFHLSIPVGRWAR